MVFHRCLCNKAVQFINSPMGYLIAIYIILTNASPGSGIIDPISCFCVPFCLLFPSSVFF